MTELFDAIERKVEALPDSGERPPERARKAINGVPCWRQISATDALSMSAGLTLNISYKKLVSNIAYKCTCTWASQDCDYFWRLS